MGRGNGNWEGGHDGPAATLADVSLATTDFLHRMHQRGRLLPPLG